MEYKPTIKLVLVDDHPGVRRGIRDIIRSARDISIVGEGENGADAFQLAITKRPDIMLLDVELPDERGDIVMRRILEKLPETKVLAVSAHVDRQYILEMLGNGASGYITKDEVGSTLIKAIRKIVKEGKNWISARTLKKVTLANLPEMTLSSREIDIFEQLVLNKSEDAIAEALDLDEAQVKKLIELLMKKYRVDSLSALKVIGRHYFSDLRTDQS
jgi:DNA-binding NarL/FixJ family response regulator